LLPYAGPGWFYGSLAEPVACVLHAFRAQIHRNLEGTLIAGPVAGGRMALLGAMGPMGMAALDCALHRPLPPRLLVVTSRDIKKLAEAEALFPIADAKARGITLVYLGAPDTCKLPEAAMPLSAAQGFDDVFVFAPDRDLVEAGAALLSQGGCLNMFAGPMDKAFAANINFYNVHYLGAHVTGTYSAQTQDMREALAGMAAGTLDPSYLVTHVGGLDAVPALLPQLPKLSGWKKLIYPALNLPLFALADLPALAASDSRYEPLRALVASHQGRWNVAAETYLLSQPDWQAPV
jgi:L-sorbose 1-phosphate reductase